jgi:PAS domain-containing protein
MRDEHSRADLNAWTGQPRTDDEFRDGKEAEKGIHPKDMELRELLDLTPQLVAVFGPDRKRLYANRPALDYLGLTLEE